MTGELPTRISHYPPLDGPLPDGARWVGQPSRWGNPHRPDEYLLLPGIHARHRAVVLDYRQHALAELRDDPSWLDPLRDATHLACSCPAGMACHADALIDLLGQQ